MYSILIIAMMWLRPQGLVGAINRKAPKNPADAEITEEADKEEVSENGSAT